MFRISSIVYLDCLRRNWLTRAVDAGVVGHHWKQLALGARAGSLKERLTVA
jgi:hypothetical protein